MTVSAQLPILDGPICLTSFSREKLEFSLEKFPGIFDTGLLGFYRFLVSKVKQNENKNSKSVKWNK